jgi:hypothetical protein
MFSDEFKFIVVVEALKERQSCWEFRHELM